MTFSRRIVLVYTSIIIIPLAILIIGILFFSLRKEIKKLEENAITDISFDTQNVYRILKEFNSIESIILSDDEFNLFLNNPNSHNEDEMIKLLSEKTTLFEHLQVITVDIYGIRIFTNNSNILERWPVILQSSRLKSIPQKWTLNYQADYLGNLNALKKESVCLTREIIKNHRLVGYFQVSTKMEDFFPTVYKNQNPHIKQYIFQQIKNTQNFNIYENKTENNKNHLTKKELKIIKNITEEGGTQKIGSIMLRPSYEIISWSYIPEMELYLITKNTNEKIIQNFAIYIITFLLILIFLVVALHLIVKYASNRLLSGIYSVMDGMKKVKVGELSVQIPVSGIDEVVETQQIFNSMTKQLSNQIEQIKMEQKLIAETEMKAMQNQINAHFLYNVLETIRMQAVLAEQDDISESLQVLGKMMHYCLRWKIHRVTLAQEIEYIRSYVYILNVINDYKISLQVEIPDKYLDVEIPKMTLQPLIENAFVHAIEKTQSDAVLRVSAQVSEDKSNIILSVQDFGEGMSEEKVQNIKDYLADSTYEKDTHGSIGLKNIQQRLTVFYGNDYKIKIDSKLGEGTTISVPFPLKKIDK